jgi:hypothetical protein
MLAMIITLVLSTAQAKGLQIGYPSAHLGSTAPISAMGDAGQFRAHVAAGVPAGIAVDYAGPLGQSPFAWEAQAFGGFMHGGAMGGLWIRGGAPTHAGLHGGLRLSTALRAGYDAIPALVRIWPAPPGPHAGMTAQVAWGWGERAAIALNVEAAMWLSQPVAGVFPGADVVVELPVGERQTVFFGVGVPAGVTAGMRF